jgi:2'-5' RNA ligase
MPALEARLFFALPVAPPLADSLAALGQAMARAGDGRAVPAGNLHVTLAFLGNVHRARIHVLTAVAAGLHGLRVTLTLDTQGTFRRAGVAWIAPREVPAALQALHAALSDALVAAGFALEPRAWRPHVTLARHCARPVAPVLRAPLHLDVDAFALYESVTEPAGPRYDELGRWPLSQPPLPPAASGPRSTRSTSPDKDA